MTEDDVLAMEVTVLATPMDPEVEQAWAARARTEFRAQEQTLMAEWRMYRHSRQDKQMSTVAKALAEVRTHVDYLTGVIGDGLAAPEPAAPPSEPPVES